MLRNRIRITAIFRLALGYPMVTFCFNLVYKSTPFGRGQSQKLCLKNAFEIAVAKP
jgi:hypothetical protein